MITFQQWLHQTTQLLSGVTDTASLDARVLLAYCLDKPQSYLLTWPEKPMTNELLVEVNELRSRRAKGEPIAYITGFQEFWSLEFNVNPAVLIPRADTELMVEWALEIIEASKNKNLKLLELGTGSGAISIALAKAHPELQLVATDFSEAALSIAEENAELNQCSNIEFIQGSWFDCLTGRTFDLIVSNPPYLAPTDPHLLDDTLKFEPRQALVAEKNGLADSEEIIKTAKLHLRLGGRLGLEHGYEQSEAIIGIMQREGYLNSKTLRDLAGLDRLSICNRGED
ncbi:MAG: protein-(glutamine-N5) methyltransferase, release factor-specific [Gammaproteobacteria bacterium]|nr:MAG: protein-(glutamine-N5) methyltransferase, release factor-specific [Gammaproteobacteria bacterium]